MSANEFMTVIDQIAITIFTDAQRPLRFLSLGDVMDQDMRDRIRHLYFVERVPMREIAEALALSAHAVRGALVLPGGRSDRLDPAPIARALADVASPTWQPDPSTPGFGPQLRRRFAGRHR